MAVPSTKRGARSRGRPERIGFDRRTPPPRAFGCHGDETWIVPPAEVVGAEAIELGHRVIILEHARLAVDAEAGARLRIGDDTRIARGMTIECSCSIVIGRGVSTSDDVAVVDSLGPYGHGSARAAGLAGPVVIEDGAYLGCGAVVGPGVVVGRGAFVGERAVVVDDVPPHSVVYGNPALVVREYDGVAWRGSRLP